MNPAFLGRLSPIVTLSVGVAVTSSLKTNAAQRLDWLDVVLQSIDLKVRRLPWKRSIRVFANPSQDQDIRDVAPSIMENFHERLNELYMAVVGVNPHDPITRKIAMLSRRVRELRG